MTKTVWNGLVYLHGLISESPTEEDLDRLVVSSGDFGLAYLTERWASAFVTELFGNFTVCFVGYSLSDPVIRYMTDALAANKLKGENHREMFAFSHFRDGQEEECRLKWRSKNVTPILYSIENDENHETLHKTLRTWAATYRDGLSGKETIIRDYASLDPGQSTSVDNFQGRVAWALSDESGVPARCFAEMDPVPPFAWLAAVVEPNWERWKFCREILPKIHAWLVRHLNNPELALFLARHPAWKSTNLILQINGQLKKIHIREAEGKAAELDEYRAHSPDGIPGKAMSIFWRLYLADRIAHSNSISFNLSRWADQVRREGMTPSLRSSLREHLTPRVLIQGIYHNEGKREEEVEFDRIFFLDVILGEGHAETHLSDWSRSSKWGTFISDLAYDFTMLLLDAMGLLQETGTITKRNDFTNIRKRTIASNDKRNSEITDWIALIKPAWDSFMALASLSPAKAEGLASYWMECPFPLFKRLAFFAATTPGVISPEKSLDWLLVDEGWWLFTPETAQEMMDLIAQIHPKLNMELRGKLEGAMLRGPSDEHYRKGLEPERLQQAKDQLVLSRLRRMQFLGFELQPQTMQALTELAARYPDWRPDWDPEDQEEFLKFMAPLKTPEGRDELKRWVIEHPQRDHRGDDWDERCITDLTAVVGVLKELADEGHWFPHRWSDILSTVIGSEEDNKLSSSSWLELAKFLAEQPETNLLPIAGSLSWWIEDQAKHLPESENGTFFALCDRVLGLAHTSESNDPDPVFNAFNHPVGRIAIALLDHWLRKTPLSDEGLPVPYSGFFERFVNGPSECFHHARLLLATRTVTFFLVDPDWTKVFLLPLFDWKRSAEEALRAWMGFLRNPRWLLSLMELLKADFLEAAQHYQDLGKYSHQFAILLHHVLFRSEKYFSVNEQRVTLSKLPNTGLETMAILMAQKFSAIEENGDGYWNHRIKPIFQNVWPKSNEKLTPQLSCHLARLCVETNAAFPDALDILKNWFQPGEYPSAIIQKIIEVGLASRYPAETLDFLDRIIDTKGSWCFDDLEKCLKTISDSHNGLEQDDRFRALKEFHQRHRAPTVAF